MLLIEEGRISGSPQAFTDTFLAGKGRDTLLMFLKWPVLTLQWEKDLLPLDDGKSSDFPHWASFDTTLLGYGRGIPHYYFIGVEI